MGRTTFTIDDRLLRVLKKESAEEGRTLGAVTNDLLRRELETPPRPPYELRLRAWKAAALPEVDLSDRNALFELMNGR